MPLTRSKLFKVIISDDRLTATLALNGAAPATAPSCDQITEEIAEIGLILDEQAPQLFQEFAQALASQEIPEPVVIARGLAPVHDTPGRIEKLYQDPDDPENQNDAARKSHYDRSNIIAVAKDAPLVRLVAPLTGSDGSDVFGKTIARKLAREAQLRPGPNTRLDGDTIIADAAGRLVVEGDRIRIEPSLQVNSDVDFSVGNIDFPGDVFIARNVLDLFHVKALGSITVQGIVEAAEIHAGVDLHIRGGIAAKEKGRCSADHDLTAKYITNASIRAGGNVTVHTEILHSDVGCHGRLTVEKGQLVGGIAVARGGATLRNLGSDANTKTILEIGLDATVRDLFLENEPLIRKSLAKAKKTRSLVEPLLANQKHLSAEQKEKATELLYTAYDLVDSAHERVAAIRAAWNAMLAEAQPEVVVLGTVYPGVIVRFPRVETVIRSSLSGPLTLAPRKVDGILRVVAIAEKSGSVHPLEPGHPSDDIWDRVEALLNEFPPKA